MYAIRSYYVARQRPNVFRMKLLGADVIPVRSGSKTLKDAINEAIRDWVTNVEDTHYLLGSALGPHPVITSYSIHYTKLYDSG